MTFRAKQFELRFPRPAVFMGVLNVTPDSFSDGGRFGGVDQAVEHALRMQAEGAEIIDVGGESTRPGARTVGEQEELDRVLPVLAALQGRLRAAVSIDTRKSSVARAALAAGAVMVNDVAANRSNPEMWDIIRDTGAGYVCMHMRGEPETMQVQPAYDDVVAEVERFFIERLALLAAAGVAAEQVLLDVGIGFGKLLAHNLELLSALDRFTILGRPLLLGVSRKSFIARLLDLPVEERLPAGIACACWAVERGARIIRTHDVAPTLRAVRMWEAVSLARK